MKGICAKAVFGSYGVLMVLTLAAAANAQSNTGRTVDEVYRNIKVMNGTLADQLNPAMQFFGASLGVECEYCHFAERDRDTPNKETARAMIRMVNTINRDNFNGERIVTCNTCHGGSVDPARNTQLTDATHRVWDPESDNGAPNLQPIAGPPPQQLLENFVKALGGTETLGKISSRVVKMTATDSLGRSVGMELVSKGDNGLLITHQANGDAINGRSGNAGWIRAVNGGVRDARQYEYDEAKLQDLLYLATHLNQISGLESRRARLGNREVYEVRGMAFGRVPIRLSFNPNTGNLLRLALFTESFIGQNQTRIDYSDFRDVNGTRFPFQWTIATPRVYQTVLVDDLQHNVAVEDSRFTRPGPPPAR